MIPATPLPPPARLGFDTGWAYLKDGLDALMFLPQPELSRSYMMALMTVCYNCCHPDYTLPGQGMFRRERSASMAAQLHQNITEYLAALAATLREPADCLEGVALLKYYAEKWVRYEMGAKAADSAFMHHRKWVMHRRQEGNTEILPIYQLALVQWKTHFLSHGPNLHEKLSAALVQLLEGEYTDTENIGEAAKTVVRSVIALGIDERHLSTVTSAFYTELLETPLVAAAENSFRTRSATILASTSVPKYMRQARDCLSQVRHVEGYLPSKTFQTLVAKWMDTFVHEHADHLWQHFRTLIFLDKREDLRTLYTLFASVPGALEPMHQRFTEDVKREGLAAISKLAGDDPGASQPDAEAYIEIVLDIHRKYAPIVQHCFEGDTGFTASLQSGCRGFLSGETLASLSQGKAPELLVKRADALLRKRRKAEGGEDLERAMNDVATLFSYIDDKDVFQRLYAIRLVKRLIYDDSVSEEAEAGMLSRLQDVCGAEYTSKLQRMLADMSLSKDLNARFQAHTQTHCPALDLTPSVTIFGANVWPLSAPADSFALPAELLPAHTRFTTYYRKAHAGRKLHWLHAHSRNELRVTLSGRMYTFVANTHQTAVLLQFNACDMRSFADLQAATALPDEPLRSTLAPLVKASVLVEKESHVYMLNLDFTSPKTRVNLHAPPTTAPLTEAADARAAVALARTHALRAAIVRIMKARRTLPDAGLVEALRAECVGRFTLELAEIHEAIEKLVEQEYIAHGEGDAWVYVA